ncbi:hypothetical protein OIU76_009081 [Salix suchowensis]|nr:hypothetical protein OIU76_009081 [Salix suchowensis]
MAVVGFVDCAQRLLKMRLAGPKLILLLTRHCKQHTKFCQQFRSSTPPRNPTEELISAIKQLLRRGLDSPRKKKCSFFPSEGSSFSIES